jgi:hypothetical protein
MFWVRAIAVLIQCSGDFTAADFQRFRCGTLLIFHDTVTERARHAACGGIYPAKPGRRKRSLRAGRGT